MILLQVQDILLPFLNPAAATEAAAAKLHRAATISHLSTPEDKESKLRHVSDSSIVSVCVVVGDVPGHATETRAGLRVSSNGLATGNTLCIQLIHDVSARQSYTTAPGLDNQVQAHAIVQGLSVMGCLTCRLLSIPLPGGMATCGVDEIVLQSVPQLCDMYRECTVQTYSYTVLHTHSSHTGFQV